MSKKLVLMCAVLVLWFSAAAGAALKVEFNDTVAYGWGDSPADWYTIERNDIWAQGGQDVSFTFNGTDLGDVTVGIKNNSGGGEIAVGRNWEGGYETSGDLGTVAKDALHVVCENCGSGIPANIGLSFSGLSPYTLYQLTTYHTYFEPVTYGGAAEDVTVSAGGFVQGTVTPGTPDPVNVGTDMPYIVSTFVTDASGAYSDIAITAPPDADATGEKKMNAFTSGFELMIAPAQPRAYRPDPPNGGDNVCPDAVLSWEPGQYADTHDVYFGTDETAVENATTATAGVYQGNQEANEFDTTPLSLQFGETYYWRVDEVNDVCDPYLWPGSVWTFTINDRRAFDPSPSDGYARLFPGEALTWSPGCTATSHDVYVGTDSAAVNAATPGVHPNVEYDNVASPNYTPSLDPFTTYYWRVDEVDGGTFKGDIWTFKTGLGGLIMHYKFNGTPDNDLPSTVIDDSGNSISFTKYTSGGGSVKYGQSNPIIIDSTASADFDPCSGLFRADTGEHDMLRLDGKEYTIEMWVRPEVLTQEHDDIMLIGKRGGASWEVTIEDPEPGSNRSYNWNHAGKGLHMFNNSAVEGEWAHVAAVYDRYTGDSNNLRLYLNGTVKDAERFENQNPPDGNMVTIGMEEIEDGPVYSGFLNGLIDELRIHDIALTPCDFLLRPAPEYAGCPNPEDGQYDVDPNLVLSWGAGSEATSHNVYLGTSYDDVLTATTATAGIYLGNVTVNHYPEPGLLELEKGRTYYWRVDEVNGGVYKGAVWSFETVTSIFDPNLRAWYKFDEESDYTARDSSGRRHDAPVDTGDPDWDPNDGRFGGSLGFDDDTDVECPRHVLDTVDSAISVSVWLKDAWRGQAKTNWVYSSVENNGCIVQAAVVEGSTKDVIWRAGDNSMDVLKWNLASAATLEDWHHWVFIKDEAADAMSIYFDSILVKSKDTENDDVNDTLVNIKGLPSRLGAAQDGANDFEGRMDDARIYDKALSAAEIQALFRGGDVASAWAPQPYDGQSDVPRNTQLIWKPGDYAQFHDVYFGADFDDVNDGTTSSGVYKSRLAVDVNYYEPTPVLDLDSIYYWRIDEVNTTDPNTWKGKVWSFTVADFLIVDNMESYNAIPLSGNEIYDTWDDGFMNWTGAQVALEYGSAMVHGGVQAMKLVYDNSMGFFKFSEIDANTTGPRPGNLDIGVDWTDVGVRTLTLFFYGQSTNDSDEQMYVALEDGSNVAIAEYGDLGEDMNDIKQQEWRQWDIPMTAFSGNGLITTNVTKVRIGFGDRDTPVAGGSGTVFFDDIRLYLPKCVPWLAKPAADFSNSCIVDLADVAIMAEDWLRTDTLFLSVQQPDYTKRVGWWKLDNTPWDGSGNFYDGNLEGSYSWVTGYIGSAISFGSEGGKVVVPDGGLTPKLRPASEITVAAWVKYSATPAYSARVVAKGIDAGNRENFALQISDDSVSWFVRDVNEDIYGAGDAGIRPNEWTHIAGTYDGSTVACYVNGSPEDSDVIGAIPLLQDSNALAIGNAVDAYRAFIGTVDDVQVYEYGLSDAEIAHIATGGSSYMPLMAETNLYNAEPQGDRAVNFRDYAVLMDNWLQKVYWP
ncbi:MAG: LamG domain-containing protein [Planctomycetota bacterium]|jgi:hypothetical protein